MREPVTQDECSFEKSNRFLGRWLRSIVAPDIQNI